MDKSRAVATGAALLACALASSCGPAVSHARPAPAPYDLGPVKTLALVSVRGGPSEARDRFVDELLSQEWRRGSYEVIDARDFGATTRDVGTGGPRGEDLVSKVRADVYFEAELSGCGSRLESEVVNEKDRDGNEVSKTRRWYGAACTASLEMVDPRGSVLASFEVTGRSESSKGETALDSDQDDALTNAVADAAEKAASAFTPRKTAAETGRSRKAPPADASRKKG